MQQYNVEELFPTPVISMILSEDTEDLKNINDFTAAQYTTEVAKDLDPYNNDMNITPDGGGKRVLENYPRIRDIFLEKFSNIAEEYLGYRRKKYMISTSWVTYTKRGGRSQQHKHRNSFWSGVYYFQDEYPEGSAGIAFHNPWEGAPDINFADLDIENFNKLNSNMWCYQPQPKQLLLFPSHLEHEIMTHEADTLRHSLAFNIVPVERWGGQDSSFDVSWVVPEFIKQIMKGANFVTISSVNSNE